MKRLIRPLGVNQTFSDSRPRRRICWHWTAGYSAESSIQSWNADQQVIGAAYVIERDGTVYQCFDEATQWAWSLGIAQAVGVDRARVIEAETVGIEIASVGPLRRAAGELRDTLNNRLFCSLDEKDKYDFVSGGFRRFDYFAAPTPQQVTSARMLAVELMKKHQIPNVVPTAGLLGKTDARAFGSWAGMCSHVNFSLLRWDWPPYWPQYFTPRKDLV